MKKFSTVMFLKPKSLQFTKTVTIFFMPFFFFGMVYPISPSSFFVRHQEPQPNFIQGELGNNFVEKLPEIRPLQIPAPLTIPSSSSSSSEHESFVVESSISSTRKSKFFPFFLVQFPNEPCSNAGGTQHGVCVSARDCRAGGGTTVATCAQGFGACCKYVKSCGSEGGDVQVRENSTEIKSINGSSSSCRFILPRTRGICQVRLDFVNFQYGQASENGDCSQTKLEINYPADGTGSFPNLCGNLTGQHLYLAYGTAERLYINSGEPSSVNDSYSIRVSYIRCDSSQIVPAHCAQYYTGNSGQIRSFNWPRQQLNNQDYTICVADPRNTFIPPRKGRKFLRQEKSSQKIQWSTCASSYLNGSRDFFISGKINKSSKGVEKQYADCENTDYIQIFGGNKQCGNEFTNETITSPPYLMRVKFDGMESPYVRISLSSQGQGQHLTVGRPDKGCESLNTKETKCLENSSNFCDCERLIMRDNSKMQSIEYDEKNTGFCLSYKIFEN